MEISLNILSLFVIVLGPIWASFFAARVMRMEGLTGARGQHSACDHCGHRLRIWELLPLLSFLLQRGRCTSCAKPINPKIWLAEVLGLLFSIPLGIMIFQFAPRGINDPIIAVLIWASILFFVIIGWLILYLAIFDMFTYTIPAAATQVLVLIAVAGNVLFALFSILDKDRFWISGIKLGLLGNLLSGLIAAAAVWGLIWLTKQKGMGVGDIYIMLVVGLMLGPTGLIAAFYVSVFSATLVGFLMAWHKGRYKGLQVPLVPFLALGYVVGLVWGTSLVSVLFWGL